MAFEPKNEKHAIEEVVFGIFFSNPLTPVEIEAVASEHNLWKKDLPRLSRGQILDLVLGNSPFSPPPPSPVIDFERIKPDGTLGWRLHVESTAIFVNCLEYEGWQKAWPIARDYLSSCARVATSKRKNAVASCIYQVVDRFNWVGEIGEYDAKTLFREGSAMIPSSVMSSGPMWHLHQGWFVTSGLPNISKRLLERVHIDSSYSEGGIPNSRLDVYHDLQMTKPIAIADFQMIAAEASFNFLHDKNKTIVRSLIVDSMCKKVSLDG